MTLEIAQYMTIATFFSKNYLFDPPTYQSKLYLPLLIVFGLMILFAIAALLPKGKLKKITKRFIAPFLTIGILGLLYLFSRYESLPYITSRFFLLLILAAFVVWTLVILSNLAKHLPKYVKAEKNEERYRKYLPKSRRR